MAELLLAGAPASPGIAAGAARVLDPRAASGAAPVPAAERPAHRARALDALTAAGADLERLAERLRGEGRDDEAELVGTAALMAADPGLAERAGQLADAGHDAAEAVRAAAEAEAELIAAIPDPVLAARADDVRSVGRRAAALAGGSAAAPGAAQPAEGEPAATAAVLVAADLGPADVAELDDDVQAIALAAGAVSAHAAIVARSLGVPMLVGLGDALLETPSGAPIVVDADAGVAVLRPDAARTAAAGAAAARRAALRRRWLHDAALPARTRDGHGLAVRANVASEAEVAVGLGFGADGAGLIRTELAFLDAAGWPSQDDHRRALDPVLRGLRGRSATVRVLDFGADKTPPFLRGARDRGLALLLTAPDAFAAQLRAILDAGRECDLRVLLPMVAGTAQLDAARALLRDAAEAVGVAVPPVGAMVETPGAAAVAPDLAARAEFLSVGTNDLTATTLDVDRFGPGEARPHHPRVLALIGRCSDAAHAAGRVLEVCGEAASSPLTLPLLVGLGVDELSVGAARVGAVRAAVRSLDRTVARTAALRALETSDAAGAAAVAAPLARSLELLEAGDVPPQGLDGPGRVAAVGT